MKLNEVITLQTYNEAVAATFGEDDIYNVPSWISAPFSHWYSLNQNESAINDDSTIMGNKLIVTLMRYRDRIQVKYNQYNALINTLKNPSLTSKTTSDNTLSNTTTNESSNTGNSSVTDKYQQGMGGGDLANQSGNFSFSNDQTNSTDTATSNSTGKVNETNNLVTSTSTTDAYMSLEGLKHDITTIFTSVFEDLTLTLLLNIW